MTDAELAHTKELAFWMTERVFMNPISAKLLNEDWRKAFPDEVAVAERMKALVEALEKAQQRITELEQKHCGGALMERELAHSEVINKLMSEIDNRDSRIAELESRAVTFKLPSTPEPSAFAPWVAKAFYQFHKDTVKSCVAIFSDACAAAGIKVEVE
ncbi:TPA: hypothetical protein NDU57_005231 [Klebsiella pneumoniae]|nr:hypothetical protein [Klebsiella pneumoniae]